jgi:hypothetical protein
VAQKENGQAQTSQATQADTLAATAKELVFSLLNRISPVACLPESAH